jgi:hypothetical protein
MGLQPHRDREKFELNPPSRNSRHMARFAAWCSLSCLLWCSKSVSASSEELVCFFREPEVEPEPEADEDFEPLLASDSTGGKSAGAGVELCSTGGKFVCAAPELWSGVSCPCTGGNAVEFALGWSVTTGGKPLGFVLASSAVTCGI